jgi:excisionase family DNA binding protein
MMNDIRHAGLTLKCLPTDLISTTELALLLKCAASTVRDLHHRGVLRGYRIGRCFRFDFQQALSALSVQPIARRARNDAKQHETTDAGGQSDRAGR